MLDHTHLAGFEDKARSMIYSVPRDQQAMAVYAMLCACVAWMVQVGGHKGAAGQLYQAADNLVGQAYDRGQLPPYHVNHLKRSWLARLWGPNGT